MIQYSTIDTQQSGNVERFEIKMMSMKILHNFPVEYVLGCCAKQPKIEKTVNPVLCIVDAIVWPVLNKFLS